MEYLWGNWWATANIRVRNKSNAPNKETQIGLLSVKTHSILPVVLGLLVALYIL